MAPSVLLFLTNAGRILSNHISSEINTVADFFPIASGGFGLQFKATVLIVGL